MSNSILIVEDDIEWQKQLQELLEEENLTSIYVKSTIAEAIELLDTVQIKLAIVDINLTDVPENRDGEILIQRYLRDIPYIIVSGTIPADASRLTNKAVAFFEKQRLFEQIDKFLETVTSSLSERK